MWELMHGEVFEERAKFSLSLFELNPGANFSEAVAKDYRGKEV